MFLSGLTDYLQHRLRRFSHDPRGVSAVEFALLLPLMLTLYFGVVEVSQGVAVDRKVTMISRTLADLISQVSSVSTTDMSNVLDASTSIITPYSGTPLRMTISCVRINGSGVAKVGWSVTRGGTARTVNSTVTVPSALSSNNSTLIWSEVSYVYTPTIGYVITGPITLFDQMYMRPRLSDTVGYSSYPCT